MDQTNKPPEDPETPAVPNTTYTPSGTPGGEPTEPEIDSSNVIEYFDLTHSDAGSNVDRSLYTVGVQNVLNDQESRLAVSLPCDPETKRYLHLTRHTGGEWRMDVNASDDLNDKVLTVKFTDEGKLHVADASGKVLFDQKII